jgi:non-specific serine/threonine protein kinase
VGAASVFAGSLDLTAAEAVCAGDGLPPGDVLVGLAGLVDKSVLLLHEERSGPVRYRWLETLREYGSERLADAGEQLALRSTRSKTAD